MYLKAESKEAGVERAVRHLLETGALSVDVVVIGRTVELFTLSYEEALRIVGAKEVSLEKNCA